MRHPLALVAGILVACVVVIVAFPKLVTGDYYTMTVESIRVRPGGQGVDITLHETISSGTRIVRKFRYGPLGSASEGEPHFPAWPVHKFSLLGIAFDEPYRLDPDHAAEAIDIQVGQSYTIRPGKPLTLFRVSDPSGRVQEYIAEVKP